ncbi:DUF4394 domain-containing protein [Quadrisphaera sp. DSM 44207]|uniref:DUF4394 domain-containing protein n=1 Tax=Quadrisphaera sp. DSM 44207 TaxID=1881057 RepID=UPI000885A6AD|nr:DUF4394 domain-containing protein [Quadrisphaera sp. DSM 44207]SDQ05863.1 protein of unknown function [Quadrisphaera sp. DSM 44207]
MRRTARTTTAVTTALLAVAVLAPATASADGQRTSSYSTGSYSTGSYGGGGYGDSSGYGLAAVGLSDGGKGLVAFTTTDPGSAQRIGDVKGLQGDTRLVGIDYRVQNGKLYGVGERGGIYLLGDRDAAARKVGQLSVALEGRNFGVDFNPAANALRITSDTGQNLRQPFAGGTADAPSPTAATVVDGRLTYDGAPATGISGSAYTNNDLSADTATTLYDLDTAMDQVALQVPANAGTLSATGRLRVDAGPDAGFDIYSTVRDGRTTAVEGWATLTVGGSSRLYAVDLPTGRATDRGGFRTPVTDLAIGLAQR